MARTHLLTLGLTLTLAACSGCTSAYWQGVRERLAEMPDLPAYQPPPRKGWFVQMYSGQIVAGPFMFIDGCEQTAAFLQRGDYRVSTLCVYK